MYIYDEFGKRIRYGGSVGVTLDGGGVASGESAGSIPAVDTPVAPSIPGTPGTPVTPSAPAATSTGAPALLSSADILAQGRNLALAGVPLAVGGVLESVNALQAKASGSAAEILPSVIENLGQLRGQYAGASQAIAKKLGYAGGGQTLRAQQANLGGATRQYAGLIQNAQQQGIAGLNQVQSGFAPLVSGVAKEPSRALGTSPFDASSSAAGIGSLLGDVPGLAKTIGGLFAPSTVSTPDQAANTIQGFRNTGFDQGVVTPDVPVSDTTVPIDTPTPVVF